MLYFFVFIWIFSPFISYADSPLNDYLFNIEIENENSGMNIIDCVYVINLEKRSDKWIRTKEALNKYLIYPNRVNAFNGWLMTQEEKQNLFGTYPIILRGGEIGCLISHISVIRDAYQRGYECIWVCEDDIAIYESPHKLRRILTKLYSLIPDWDVLYTDIDSKDSEGNRVPSISSLFRPDQQYHSLDYYTTTKQIHKDILEIRQRFGAYSMLISRRGIEKILNYFSNVYLWASYDVDIHYIPSIKEFSLTRDLISIDFNQPSDTKGEIP